MKKLYLLISIIFLNCRAHAVRPFVTDDARIIDSGQVTSEIWFEESFNKASKALEVNALVGASLSRWLEVTMVGGTNTTHLGRDFTNPVLQSKFLLRPSKEDGPVGIALSLGHVANQGSGDLRFDGSSSYALALFTKRFKQDHLLLHLNLGVTRNWLPKEDLSESGPFWGIGAEFALWAHEWRGVVEVFSGDPFHPIRSDGAGQMGMRWLHSERWNFDAIIGAEPEISNRGSNTGSINSWIQFGVRFTDDLFRG